MKHALIAAATATLFLPNASVASRGQTLVTVHVTDKVTGAPVSARVTVLRHSGKRVNLGPSTGRDTAETTFASNFAYAATGSVVLQLAPGKYHLVITQGPEWTAKRLELQVGAAPLTIHSRLEHVVDSRGWLAADLHVHAERSSDSKASMIGRIRQLICEGIEFFAATDHNTITDYAPLIEHLGAQHLLLASPGYELTTWKWGHFGVFPLPKSYAGQPRGSVLNTPRRSDAEGFFELIRAASPEAFIIVNHPHWSSTASYFWAGKYNAHTGRAIRGFSHNFHGIELLNGHSTTTLKRSIAKNIPTWFAMLRRGHRVTAVTGSDSHALRGNTGMGGYPRTWVQITPDRPDSLAPVDISRALHAGRAVVSTAPFVTISVGKHGIGDTVATHSGSIPLDIRVQAAPWVDITALTIYRNGEPVARLPVRSTHEPQKTTQPKIAALPATNSYIVRADMRYYLPILRDSFVVVRVDGPPTLYPFVGEPTHSVPVFAITNPIYIDTDGNGVYDAPNAKR